MHEVTGGVPTTGNALFRYSVMPVELMEKAVTIRPPHDLTTCPASHIGVRFPRLHSASRRSAGANLRYAEQALLHSGTGGSIERRRVPFVLVLSSDLPFLPR
jgi:hypothetical protein